VVFRKIYYICVSWIRVVGTATRLRNRRFWVKIQVELIFFFYSEKRPYRLWDPPSFVLNEYRLYFQEVKRPGLEPNHSPPSSTEVKNECSHTPIPPVYLTGVDRDNFTLPFCMYLFVSCCIFLWNCLIANESVIATVKK
jgi:hypothetical protein